MGRKPRKEIPPLPSHFLERLLDAEAANDHVKAVRLRHDLIYECMIAIGLRASPPVAVRTQPLTYWAQINTTAREDAQLWSVSILARGLLDWQSKLTEYLSSRSRAVDFSDMNESEALLINAGAVSGQLEFIATHTLGGDSRPLSVVAAGARVGQVRTTDLLIDWVPAFIFGYEAIVIVLREERKAKSPEKFLLKKKRPERTINSLAKQVGNGFVAHEMKAGTIKPKPRKATTLDYHLNRPENASLRETARQLVRIAAANGPSHHGQFALANRAVDYARKTRLRRLCIDGRRDQWKITHPEIESA